MRRRAQRRPSPSSGVVAGLVVFLVYACSSTHSTSITPEDDRESVDFVTGEWSLRSGPSAGVVTLVLCEDRGASHCAKKCPKVPCHDVSSKGVEQELTYESSEMMCDCYGCECAS